MNSEAPIPELRSSSFKELWYIFIFTPHGRRPTLWGTPIPELRSSSFQELWYMIFVRFGHEFFFLLLAAQVIYFLFSEINLLTALELKTPKGKNF